MKVDRLQEYLKKEFEYYNIDYVKRSKAWVKWHRQWRGVLETPTKPRTRKSSLFINRTRKAIRAALANIMDILFSSHKVFDVAGRTEFDQKGAETIYKITKWLLEIGDFKENVRQFILQAAIYGTAFAKIVWKDSASVSINKLPIQNFISDTVGFETKLTKKVVSFPAIIWVDIFDMWVDPDAICIEEARGLFHRTKRSLEYLKEKEREGVYFNIESIKSEGDRNIVLDTRRTSIGLSSKPPPQENELYIYEYWGRIPVDIAKEAGLQIFDNEFDVECIVTLANMDTVIRIERNTFPNQERMFISQKWEDSGDRELNGVGVCENVRGEQVALNATINHRIDNKSWATGSPLVANVSKLQDEKDLVARNNWIIRVIDNPDNVVKAFAIPDVSTNAYVEAREFERFIEEESGINKFVEADESFGSNRTLGGISLAFNAASRPIRLIARGFENSIISRGVKLLFTSFLNQLDRNIIIRVLDDPSAPQFLEVDPISIALDVDFIPLGTLGVAAREGMMQDILGFIQSIGQVGQLPASDGQPIISHINWEFIIKKVYEGMGMKEFEKVWISPISPPAQEGKSGGQETPNERATGADPIRILAALGQMVGGQEGATPTGVSQ